MFVLYAAWVNHSLGIGDEQPSLTLLGLQSRFGDNWGQNTRNLTAMSPKRDWGSKGVKWAAQGAAKTLRYTDS